MSTKPAAEGQDGSHIVTVGELITLLQTQDLYVWVAGEEA